MKWGRYLKRGCVSTVLIVALSVGFCMPPVVTGTSAILRTASNAEVPKWPSAKPTWAKLFCKYSWVGFSGRLWRRASGISGLRVCPVCHTLQAEATYLCISWFGDLSREILAYVFSPALLFSSELLAMCIFLKWEHLKQAGQEHDMSWEQPVEGYVRRVLAEFIRTESGLWSQVLHHGIALLLCHIWAPREIREGGFKAAVRAADALFLHSFVFTVACAVLIMFFLDIEML